MEEKRPQKNDLAEISATPSVEPVMDHPTTALEQINKYGTYNIQPTADTDNEFPMIAQGLPSTDAHAHAPRPHPHKKHKGAL